VSVLVNSITSDVEEFTGSTGEQPGLSTDPGLTGTINLTRAALADLRVNQGCIVNIISESTRVGGQPMSARVGVNAGVTALTTSLAREVGVEGVRVNLVVAGDLITPERSSFGEQHRALDRLASAHPLGRLGTAADIAGAVLFLASPLAQWITGQVLSVNGGFTNTRAG
jgi:NAD(P)-dependent dehydrogenase (short-subunit alcohol dehydrogenase family)